MKFVAFSPKQMVALTWWCENSPYKDYDAIICDGAVRSGKTVCMSISFVAWAFYKFSGQSFAICGKTVSSVRRNVLTGLLPTLKELGFGCDYKVSQNLVVIKRDGKENRFYLFGGKDESSAALIQGMTLAGVLFDEVALMPRSFVEQAMARCSVEGSKFWFNCNPQSPLHWFHVEWIMKAEQKGALYLHFTMDDNLSLSEQMKKRYASLYNGSFYERFVLGKWVAASGLVYPFFDEKIHCCEPPFEPCEKYYISCDYGTVNPSSFGLWGKKDGVWYRLYEYYFDSRKENYQRTDEEHYRGIERIAGVRKIEAVVVDPSAASFIAVINKYGKFRVIPAKNEVIDGIRRVSDALKSGKIKICNTCKDAIREFKLYRWEENSFRDVPKKENDHAMDDIRYFVSTILDREQGGGGFYAFAAARGRQL